MSSSTPNLNLSKQDAGDTDWASEVNGNFDTLDTAVGTEHTSGGKHKIAAGTSFPGSPGDGEIFIRTDLKALYRYTSSIPDWIKIGDGDAICYGDAASGDLSGTYPNPTVAKIQGRDVSSSAPASDQVLKWSSGSNAWVPAEAVLDGDSAGGDLSATYPNPTVAKIQGKAVPASPSSNDLLQYDGSNWDAKGASSGDSLSDLYSGALTIVGSKHLKWNTDGGGDIGASSANRPDNIYAKTSVKVGDSCSLLPHRIRLHDNTTGDPSSLAEGDLWYNDKGLLYRNASSTLRVIDDDRAGSIALNSATGVTITTDPSILAGYIWAANELLDSSIVEWFMTIVASNSAQTFEWRIQIYDGSSWSDWMASTALNTSNGDRIVFRATLSNDPYNGSNTLVWGHGSTGTTAYINPHFIGSSSFLSTANRGLRIVVKANSGSYSQKGSCIMRELRGG